MLINRYGLDATKYSLLRELTFAQDCMFTPEGFVERYNSDLCNDLGNLLNRTIGMVNKYFDGIVPTEFTNENKEDKELEEFSSNSIQKFENEMDNYHMSNALIEIWNLISRTNKYIDETAPWVLAKTEEKEKLSSVMYHLVENLRKIAILIRPALEETSDKIFNQLGLNDDKLFAWESIKSNNIPEGTKVIEKGEPLFIRLEKEEEIEYIRSAMKGK